VGGPVSASRTTTPVTGDGRAPAPTRKDSAADLRERFARAAVGFNGLETLIVGWQESARIGTGRQATPQVVVTVWREAESMVRAIGTNDGGFLSGLGLDIAVQQADSYEVVNRTFASLPTPLSVLRIVTMRIRPSGEGAFFDRLRAIQQRLTEQGLIASHIARRVGSTGTEALILGVWIDRAVIEAASGRLEAPTYLHELEPWILDVSIEAYTALEIAPRLPMASGPPILILDGSRRVVDLTPAAAAILGRTQEDALDELVEELAGIDTADDAALWSSLLDDRAAGDKVGAAGWLLPPEGRVMIRWRLRRDVPVPGRHTILVHRSFDPEPTRDDLDAALDEAFPRVGTLPEA